MLNMGPGGWLGLGTGIAPPGTTQLPLPRVHPSHHGLHGRRCARSAVPANMVVGLISVAQLTLSVQISDIRVMTEVYNLVRIRNR